MKERHLLFLILQLCDKVLVILKRNYEYWYIVHALHKLGAVVIPATNMLTLDDITYRIETANIKFAVSTPDDVTAETLVQAKTVKSQLEKVFVVRRDVEGSINLTKEIENADENLERVQTKAKEPMLIYIRHNGLSKSGNAQSYLYFSAYCDRKILAEFQGKRASPYGSGNRLG